MYLQRLQASQRGTKWRWRLLLGAFILLAAYTIYSFAPTSRTGGRYVSIAARRDMATRAQLRAGTGTRVRMSTPGKQSFAGSELLSELPDQTGEDECPEGDPTCGTGETSSENEGSTVETGKDGSPGASEGAAGSSGGADEPEPMPPVDVVPNPVAPIDGSEAKEDETKVQETGDAIKTDSVEPAKTSSSTPTEATPKEVKPAQKPAKPAVKVPIDPNAPREMVEPIADYDILHELGWTTPQRPTLDGEERALTSHKFQELNIVSMNPPPPTSSYPADVAAELDTRLVIVIGCGVHSGHTDVAGKGYISLPVFNTMIPSFLPTAQPWHIYRFYLAFDHNDPIFESAEHRKNIEDAFYAAVATENAKRWHPPGWTPTTVDSTTLLVTLHWVHCNYAGKPAWAHSDAVMAGFKEGGDYALRTNDDTQFPEAKDWVDRFIVDLRERRPVPNLGVVGPACAEGANWILTHDFTHRTHAIIFGFQYPRSLPDWSSDDWITYMYKFYGIMSRREDTKVVHKLHGTRYNPMDQGSRLAALNKALEDGAAAIDEYTSKNFGVTLPHNLETIKCC